MSSTQTVKYALIVNQLGNIQDLKFVDDEKLMLVMSQEGKKSALMRSETCLLIGARSVFLPLECSIPQESKLV